MPTVREELDRGVAALAEAGCETPRLDAELLLARVLGTDRAGLIIAGAEPVDGEIRTRYLALLSRRARREPVAYILGRREFRRLSLYVDPRVLIPRPETELLVELGLTLARGARVADVGTGSGAVALALKDERPDLAVTGIDSSEAVLTVASSNGRRLGLEVRWALADLLDGCDYDAVIANLPYVADGTPLAPEIEGYEPVGALFAGPDGLRLIRRLIAACTGVPLLALEVGLDQADAVEELLRAAGFATVERLRDLAGIERIVVGRR